MSKETLYVIDGDQKIPFLRGMITYSLIERGLSFQEAFEAASSVRARILGKQVIKKSDLAQLIQSVVRERFGEDYIKDHVRLKGPAPAIFVKSPDSEVPFSKGILSQSLQASGLEPSIAYDIAREIEAYLLQNSRREITRNGLRRLIYETILHKHDSQFAERYLLWRCFKSPEKPLIILFGGATGTGKSSVATEVAHRLGIQKILGTDTIRQIMRMMFSHDLLPAIHRSSYEAWKEGVRLNEEKSVAVIEAFKEQCIRVLVGVRAMVGRAIEENISLIIDGVHLVPGLAELEQFEEKASLVPIIISTLNQSNYLERFPIRQREAGSRSAQRYRENFETILQIQDYILEMAEARDVPIIENDNFDETVSSILSVISNTLQEKLNIRSEDLVSKAL